MSKKHNKKKNNNNKPNVNNEVSTNEEIKEEIEEVKEEVKEEVEETVEEVKETVEEKVEEVEETVEAIKEEQEENVDPIEDPSDKKVKKAKKEKKNDGTKFSDKVSLFFRKRMFVGTVQTWIIVLLLLAIYIFIAYAIEKVELPEFDITANKLYSISDESAEAVSKIENEITIWYYGFEEKSVVIELLKKYNKINEKIQIKELTPESNYDLATEYGLIGENAVGYNLIIVESGDQKRLVDSSDFYSYDYSTGQSVDTTEQIMTNTLLQLSSGNQPKIYFATGHEEFALDKDLAYLNSLFEFEVMEANTVNIATQGVPEDCDVLVFMSPRSDLLENEVQPIKDYINKGGELYFGLDAVPNNVSLANFQQILDIYGVSVINGYLEENNAKYAVSGYPYIFNPQVNMTDDVTRDIYTSSKLLWLIYPQALSYVDDAKLKELNVSRARLLFTTNEGILKTGTPTEGGASSTPTQPVGEFDIAARLTKTLDPNKVGDTSDENTSELIIIGTSTLASDYIVQAINQSYPLAALGGNKDFVLNALNTLAGNKNIISIRKDMGSTTYTPTSQQNNIVLTIIFAVPLIIIVSGIIIYVFRRKRK